MVRKRWILRRSAPGWKELAEELAVEAGVPPLAALMALRRGMEDEEEVLAFLGQGEVGFTNPYDLPDMEEAVARIELALERGEHITVFGDYDADGVTATALLYHYLSARGASVSHYLPDRHTEGYGLNMAALDALHAGGTQLLVTVDNGCAAVREAEHAQALGMDLVITDHHQLGGRLPPVAAVVNPHRPEWDLGFRDFAGVGVAFLLVCALEGCEAEELLDSYAELLALGTVADVVPLVGENRAFVAAGLQMINREPGIGVAALRRAARSQDRSLSATGLAFLLAPRINAAGRMAKADEALALLLCGEEAEAERLAQRLDLYNRERQDVERTISDQAAAWLRDHPERQHDRVLVFAGEGWHEGVVGIAASRMVERTGKPCLIISTDGEQAKGSGRSIPGFSLFEAISHSAPILQKFGGHELAAGFSLRAKDVPRFRAELNAFAARQEMPFPVQTLDAKLNPAQLSPDFVEALSLLEPFGQGNPAPVFALQSMRLRAVTPVAQGKHLRLSLEPAGEPAGTGAAVTALCFGTREAEFGFAPGDVLDLAVTLEISEYQGQRGVSVSVKNAKFSSLPNEQLLRAQRLTEAFLREEDSPSSDGPSADGLSADHAPGGAAACQPSREDIALVYRTLRQHKRPLTPEALFVSLGEALSPEAKAEDFARFWLAAEAMRELGLVEGLASGQMVLRDGAGKVNLEDSALLARIRARAGKQREPDGVSP
ncbi:MAG: single-stranded-DNA-specific exonuclease RecJ [Oscillospiraceae bacterium]|nr:single-stranded-DNA-specific exonuclease RecJ [Oscillospiraceae bacterium]